MNGNPLVSIIIRTKDRPKLLKKALQSIAFQTYRPIEVVLVNDGGCDLNIDEYINMLSDISFNYIRLKENIGRAHAGNVGLENIKGNYVGFLDDDDELYPEHLETLTNFLFSSDYKIAYTDSLMVYKDYIGGTNVKNGYRTELAFSEDFDYDKLLFENYIPFMCLLFNRDVLITSGGFDTNLDLYEDWDLLIRIGKVTPFYHIKKITANYNQWSSDYQISQVSKDVFFLKQAYLKIIDKHFDKFTINSIHNYMSSYVNTRQMLKNIKNNLENVKDLLKEKDSLIDKLEDEIEDKELKIRKFDSKLKDIELRYERIYEELNSRDAQINNLTNMLKERDAQLSNLTNILNERDSQINSLTNMLKERDAQINNFANVLSERDAKFEKMYKELNEKGPREEILYEELKERDAQINNLTNILNGRDAQINNLTNILNDKDAQINNLTDILNERDLQINNLTNILQERDHRFNIFYAELKEKNSLISEIDLKLKEKTSEIEILIDKLKSKSSEIYNLISILKEKDANIFTLQNLLKQKENLIKAMQCTKGWRLLQKYRYVRDNLILQVLSFIKNFKSIKIRPFLKEKGSIEINPDKTKKNSLILKNKFSICQKINEDIKSKISVIIPTKNAGDEFDYTLQKIMQQEGIENIELIIVDSGSKDGTLEKCKNYTDKIFKIKPEEFKHSMVRNLGAERATGEFLVFTVQDAIPINSQWLYKLIYPIYKEQVSAVSIKQIPRTDADFFASWAVWKHNQYMRYDYDRIVLLNNQDDFDKYDIRTKRSLVSLNNVCLGIKRSVFDKYKFNFDYAEDLELGIRLLKDKHKLLFQSTNAVIHSHYRPAIYFFKRSILDTIILSKLLNIDRNDLSVSSVFESISYLHKVLKICIFTLKLECDINSNAEYLINRFIEDFKNMLSNGYSHENVISYPFIDNYFDIYSPKNHSSITSQLFVAFIKSLKEFSDFVKNYYTVDGLKNDFLESIYKIFFNTAGCFVGSNTQYDEKLIAGEI